MANLTTSEYLKYANLQMAAEAFIRDPVTLHLAATGDELKTALIEGNKHASRFTSVDAATFADPDKGWTVQDQKINTSTGFSGTLFKNNQTNELVLSFRSTEFVDDAIADSTGTNSRIFRDGWAFGQIADMEEWWASIKDRIPSGQKITVTGYSLGGHLANAFAQLRQEAGEFNNLIDHIYTFNGAGTGGIDPRVNLTQVMDLFVDVWKNHYIPEWLQKPADRIPLWEKAQSNVQSILDEAANINGFVSGIADDPNGPVVAKPGAFADVDFQFAMLVAARYTTWAGSPNNMNYLAAFSLQDVKVGGMQFGSRMTELFGAGMSGVAIAGLHHTTRRVEVRIEDQPFVRGTPRRMVTGLLGLSDRYALNDFADTHSLVLIVDSLSVMALMQKIDPKASQGLLQGILNAASASRRDTVLGEQGKAEGDVLENVTNALAKIVLGTAAGNSLKGSLDGNTWAKIKDGADYTGREALHVKLAAIDDAIVKSGLAGKLEILPISDTTSIAAEARSDYAQFLSLYYLAPFQLKPRDSTATKILQGANPELAEAWASDQQLTAEQRAQGMGTFSDSYLADRGAKLKGSASN